MTPSAATIAVPTTCAFKTTTTTTRATAKTMNPTTRSCTTNKLLHYEWTRWTMGAGALGWKHQPPKGF
eukprot:9243186-Pyramimonas_sp.AAC.1